MKKRLANGNLQVVYYDNGVGSGNALDKIEGGAFGEAWTPTSTTSTAS